MRYYKHIRIILILIPIVILGWLAYKHITPSGILKVDYDFCAEDPFISKFSPMGRVLDIEKIKHQKLKICTQAMVIDPVYFDVRLPQSFEQARITLWYKKDPDIPLRIGPRFNPNEWIWNLQDIKFERTEADWEIGTITADLSHIQMDNNRLRFLISSPGLDVSGQQIIFNQIKIEFGKQPLNTENFWSRFKNLIHFIHK